MPSPRSDKRNRCFNFPYFGRTGHQSLTRKVVSGEDAVPPPSHTERVGSWTLGGSFWGGGEFGRRGLGPSRYDSELKTGFPPVGLDQFPASSRRPAPLAARECLRRSRSTSP